MQLSQDYSLWWIAFAIMVVVILAQTPTRFNTWSAWGRLFLAVGRLVLMAYFLALCPYMVLMYAFAGILWLVGYSALGKLLTVGILIFLTALARFGGFEPPGWGWLLAGLRWAVAHFPHLLGGTQRA